MTFEETIGAVIDAKLEPLRADMARLTAAIEGFASKSRSPAGNLSVGEAALTARRHPETIRRAIKTGALAATKPERGREWIIASAELQRWMAGRGAEKTRSVDVSAEVEKALVRARGKR